MKDEQQILECRGIRWYEDLSKYFRTGHLERELQVVQLSATRCSCIAILWVSLVSFAAITLCVASQRVFIVVYFVMTQSGFFWIHPRSYQMNSEGCCINLLRCTCSLISCVSDTGFWNWKPICKIKAPLQMCICYCVKHCGNGLYHEL
jgi:hypothetical protein